MKNPFSWYRHIFDYYKETIEGDDKWTDVWTIILFDYFTFEFQRTNFPWLDFTK